MLIHAKYPPQFIQTQMTLSILERLYITFIEPLHPITSTFNTRYSFAIAGYFLPSESWRFEQKVESVWKWDRSLVVCVCFGSNTRWAIMLCTHTYFVYRHLIIYLKCKPNIGLETCLQWHLRPTYDIRDKICIYFHLKLKLTLCNYISSNGYKKSVPAVFISMYVVRGD